MPYVIGDISGNGATDVLVDPEAQTADLGGLLPALRRLDQIIARAVAAAAVAFGPAAAADPYRGLVIRAEEIARLLARAPAAPVLAAIGVPGDDAVSAHDAPRLARLGRAFDLTPFDLDTVLVTLAPELDLRYERLYAYLHDDVTRRRPSIDLALNLLCPTETDRLTQRARFAADAPLRRHGLLELAQDPNHPHSPLLAHDLKLDEQVVRWMLGGEDVSERIAGFARCQFPSQHARDARLPELERPLLIVMEARRHGAPPRIGLQGSPGNGQAALAGRLAAALDAPLLSVDLDRMIAAEPEPAAALRQCCRDARYLGAILFLDGTDALGTSGQSALAADLRDLLAGHTGPVILSGERPWPQSAIGSPRLTVVPIPVPSLDQRRDAWAAALTTAGTALPPDDVDLLASRFRLNLAQIENAIATANAAADWRSAAWGARQRTASDRIEPTLTELFRAARAQAGPGLASLAQKIEPRFAWADLVLPDDAVAQLHELCGRVNRRERVLSTWGFGRKLSLGQGTNALFAGPSGTGKTMAAEVIADDLGLDLYRIELAGVVSKYIGETEKNLDSIFAAASGANAILFFDEADALFGKRSEVRDAHDRYANIETAYLLQKMEQYDGVAILATNLRGNLDEAFTRRLAFTVHFPFPEHPYRARIWTGIWPPDVALDPDVDFVDLARRFPLSGGNIKNVALAAAYLAADSGDAVTTSHLLHAVRREYQKMGKQLTLAELIGPGRESPLAEEAAP
ncbi:MAG TPA: ATP-binding protein [Reyranella sp.]|nr:ATP-binding protein [Reyranella sp.]